MFPVLVIRIIAMIVPNINLIIKVSIKLIKDNVTILGLVSYLMTCIQGFNEYSLNEIIQFLQKFYSAT